MAGGQVGRRVAANSCFFVLVSHIGSATHMHWPHILGLILAKQEVLLVMNVAHTLR
jgi:hypothetical protein